jgi:hypothetical protein
MNEFRSQLNAPIKIDPNTAVQNPLTWNPGIRPEAMKSMNAFRTKVKRPKVSRLRGRVRMNRMGRRKEFNMLRIAAAKKADRKPLTWMPSIM